LKKVLQECFFSLAGLIQASAALHKAWEPCYIARLKLRDIAEKQENDRQLGRRSIALLTAEPYATNRTLAPVQQYVRNSMDTVEQELRQTSEIHDELAQIQDEAERYFRLFDADLSCLRALEIHAAEISLDDRGALGRLFGGLGTDVWTRLGLVSPAEIGPDVRALLWDQHQHWMDRKARASGAMLEIYTHAVERLESVLTHLEGYVDA
jgi:hypothetical protein